MAGSLAAELLGSLQFNEESVSLTYRQAVEYPRLSLLQEKSMLGGKSTPR